MAGEAASAVVVKVGDELGVEGRTAVLFETGLVDSGGWLIWVDLGLFGVGVVDGEDWLTVDNPAVLEAVEEGIALSVGKFISRVTTVGSAR